MSKRALLALLLGALLATAALADSETDALGEDNNDGDDDDSSADGDATGGGAPGTPGGMGMGDYGDDCKLPRCHRARVTHTHSFISSADPSLC